LADACLVDLSEHRFALIATSSPGAVGTGHAVVVGIEVREEAGSAVLVETGRSLIDAAIEDSGAADVDGLGTPELVLGLRPIYDKTGSCGTTSLRILDSATVNARRSIDLPGRLGRGVIGRWDGAAGDDLLAYTAPDCPPGGPGGARLTVVRLRDGTISTAAELTPSRDVSTYPAPVLVRFDGDERDMAFTSIDEGVALVDGTGGAPMAIAVGDTMPLVAGPDPGPDGPAYRLAWIDREGAHTERIRNGPGGLVVSDEMALGGSILDSERWALAIIGVATDVGMHGASSAWLGPVATEGCPDLVLPGAILPCGSDEFRPGATWLATRLVASMPIEGRLTGLVAGGLGWDPNVGAPTSPTPAASAAAGWWRHGASTPFVLSEVRGSDLMYFRDFPVPKATIEQTTDRDGSTKLPGFTGTRLFVTVVPLTGEKEGPDIAPSRIESLLEPPAVGGVVRTARVPVPAGMESGRDGSFTTLGLAGIKPPGGGSTDHWAMRVTPINDWGEVGQPVVRTITRDATGPTLNLHTPFTNPVWPFLAHLEGRAEPGSAVSIDGGAPLDVDERGRFTVVTRLAPWPQTIRLNATDASGNGSTAEFSVVGGVDYRQFPWALIVALTLLGLVAIRGLATAGRRVGGAEATPWSMGLLDEASMPEIEELPPGKGLAPVDRGFRR
ncbi:MAG TPA: hypothetical protein VK867_11325, partial [Candidatus Limnocylindrales bacterium]|nr:hypothetical protein [Candidatus Limnocylindrales bacterium]